MSTEQLVTKFRNFVEGLVSATFIDGIIDSVLGLEHVEDFSTVMRKAVWAEGGLH